MGRVLRSAFWTLAVVLLGATAGVIHAEDPAFEAPTSNQSLGLTSGSWAVDDGGADAIVDGALACDRFEVRTRHVPVAVLPVSHSAAEREVALPVNDGTPSYVGRLVASRCSRGPPALSSMTSF